VLQHIVFLRTPASAPMIDELFECRVEAKCGEERREMSGARFLVGHRNVIVKVEPFPFTLRDWPPYGSRRFVSESCGDGRRRKKFEGRSSKT
jgi:hypothetical protein